MTKFTPAERRNWGYWDGHNAAKRGRTPAWCPLGGKGKHPTDKVYGVAFWQGWYGEAHPNTGVEPGTPEFAYWAAP